MPDDYDTHKFNAQLFYYQLVKIKANSNSNFDGAF